MATKAGTGYSDSSDAATAGREAAKQALDASGADGADIVFAFASTTYDFPKLLEGIRSVTGKAPLIGSSTAGQFTQNRWGPESVSVMVVKSDSIKFRTALGRGLKTGQKQAVDEALAGFSAAHRAARSEGYTHATCIVCTDGLAGRGEDLVDAIHAGTGMLAQVVGGAAADAAKFVRTDVFFDGENHTDAIAVAYAFSKTPIGLGVRHGLNSGCASMIVSKAKDNVVLEIDGKPAVQAYEAFARSLGEPFTKETRDGFMITHEIGMLTPSGEYKIRAPLAVTDEGGLTLASEVPTGASITFMKGTKEGLVAAAELAARSAMVNLAGGRPAAVLAFDCICRRIFLSSDYQKQVDAFRTVVGADVPIAGWETYGEIAMTPSQQTGWHNSTTVLAILPD